MAEEMSDDDKLFEEAIDLVVRLQANPANPVALDLVRRWRARSAEHEAVWTEISEIHGMAGKVLDDQRRAGHGEPAITRRGVILGGGAIVLALGGGGAVFAPDLRVRAQAHHLTSTAEVKRVELVDGTAVTLGPASAIRLSFTDMSRGVELLRGMAFFEVAPDFARPFRATAGDLTSTVLGTAFDISQDAGLVTVSVDHGRVEVAVPGSPIAAGEQLGAGQWLSLDDTTLGVQRGSREPDLIAAWRNGRIVADNDTVASVVARIARWQPGRVVIADPRFGKQPISGVFDSRDPITALEAVVHPHGGRVRRITPWLTVVAPI